MFVYYITMQTFLPYKSFEESVKILDYKRLGKQRVEAYQILKALLIGPHVIKVDDKKGNLQRLTQQKTPWYNHPAIRMWNGYETALAIYGLITCEEWISRGYRDSLRSKFFSYYLAHKKVVYPWWLGIEEFHVSHRSNLLRKKKEYYEKFFNDVPSDMEYFWPV